LPYNLAFIFIRLYFILYFIFNNFFIIRDIIIKKFFLKSLLKVLYKY
jgi:hypothetical protein